MKLFVKNILLFSLPILLLGGVLELFLREIPNDYRYKREYLDKNAERITVLFLGSSYAYYGVNPALMCPNSFNAAYISQSIYYDYQILKKYQNRWNKLQYIALPVSYATLYGNLETSEESWRVKNYVLYYGLHNVHALENYSEVLSNSLKINLKRIYQFYCLGRTNQTCSSLGWGTDYSSHAGVGVRPDLAESGREAAKRNTMHNDLFFAENVRTLRSMIEFAKQRSVHLILYTPPAHAYYVKHFNPTQLKRSLRQFQELDRAYEEVSYHNFLTDSSFTTNDFYDADHLNDLGAIKLTKRLNALIQKDSETKSSF